MMGQRIGQLERLLCGSPDGSGRSREDRLLREIDVKVNFVWLTMKHGGSTLFSPLSLAK